MRKLDGPVLDEALRALSHPDRRLFVQACQGAARAAGDLAALSDLSLATISEHLKVLRKSGLLILSKQGRFWFYRTDIGLVRAVASAVAQLEET